MDDLTMLLQTTGGEGETVRRLRDAGFETIASVAGAPVEELREAAGLSLAAANRLVGTAREWVAGERPGAEPSSRGRGIPGERRAAGEAPEEEKAVGGRRAEAHFAPPADPRERTAAAGVSRPESVSLTGQPMESAWTQQSFWRFG